MDLLAQIHQATFGWAGAQLLSIVARLAAAKGCATGASGVADATAL
jgi:hypothetical protein